MPIYAFRCDACGHDFDRLQKLSDPDPEACPACDAKAVKRQLTAPAFRLAGAGWYETDFKKDGEKKRNLVESGGGGKAAETGAAKSEGAKVEGGKSEGAAAPKSGADKPAPAKETKKETKPAASPPAAG